MNLVKQYIIALTNLYGMVHKDKIAKIYNRQNTEPVSPEEIEEMSTELDDHFIYLQDEYFVHETILEHELMEEMLMKKGDKPYYVPSKEELLKYVDEWYFEKNKEYQALVNYVKKNFLKNDPEKAEEVCEDIQGILAFGFNMQAVMDVFNSKKISFTDLDQLNEVTGLVTELGNNIRIWENNGHTPEEIFENYEKPNMKPLPKKPFDFNKTNVIDMNSKKNIGRNDPCPCGSGKKYKKCCLN